MTNRSHRSSWRNPLTDEQAHAIRIGERLRAARVAKGISQEKTAARTGVTVDDVRAMELGRLAPGAVEDLHWFALAERPIVVRLASEIALETSRRRDVAATNKARARSRQVLKGTLESLALALRQCGEIVADAHANLEDGDRLANLGTVLDELADPVGMFSADACSTLTDALALVHRSAYVSAAGDIIHIDRTAKPTS